MKNIYFIWGFIVILILSVVTYFGFVRINQNKDYKEKENEIEKIVAKYLGEHLNEFPSAGSKDIKLSYIIEQGIDVDLNVNNDVCDGYVNVKKVNISYEYKGYIKCKDYMTTGYSE